MPTTQPLDDELGDDFEGRLKPIAAFNDNGAPKDAVPTTAVKPSVAEKNEYRRTISPSENSEGAVRIKGLNTPKASLKGTLATAPRNDRKDQAPTKSADAAEVRAPYSDDDLRRVWQQFVDENKAEHLLTGAMRVAIPASVGENVYRIAQSPVHIKYIRENIGRITEYVRRQLHNDLITFSLQEVSEDSPLAWNERELLKHIVEETPGVADFINKLKLKLL